MEENIQTETIEQQSIAPVEEKPLRKRRPIKKPKMRRVVKPKADKLPLGLLDKASAQVEQKKTSTPWKPARVIDIPENLKDQRFAYRWCNAQKIGNIQKKLQEGWEVDKNLSKKLNDLYGLNRTIEDGSPIDSTVRMRELIVMRIPKEMADERNEYYRNRGKIDRKSIEKGMRDNLNEQSDPANILGRSTLYSERKLEQI